MSSKRPFTPYKEYVRFIAKDKEAVKEALVLAFLDDPVRFRNLLKDLIEAEGGYSHMAKETGLSRVALHKMVGPRGNPSLQSVNRVTRALGLVTA
jgi:probable addiction module antidote protein